MAAQLLPNLPDEIIVKIIELVGEESFSNLGRFLRAGKRGYDLVHEPSVLKRCDVSDMVSFATCQIHHGCRFREFLLKCVNVGNIWAIYYEGLHAAAIAGAEIGIKIFEPNVHFHGLSTLAAGIFNVCLGNNKQASKVFQQFAAYHYDLRSDEILEMGGDLEWRLLSFGAANTNIYGSAFKFPDNEVIKSPCIYGHDYTLEFEGNCKNYGLFWICSNISHML